MKLPKDLSYSHINLQDFVNCKKLFYLRHISRLPWPGIKREPVLQHEHIARAGARFHQMVHQHLLGIPAERLSAMLQEPDLEHWWRDFLEFLPQILPFYPQSLYALYPEISLSAPLGERRLLARYDLVVAGPNDSLGIYIWNTSLRRPTREELGRHLQTYVLPYLLVRAGWHLNRGQAVQPSNVELIYWFPSLNGWTNSLVERFMYNVSSFRTDEGFLNGLVETVQRLEIGEFSRTVDERCCLYCAYRSLCERGVLACNPLELDVESPAGFELELANPFILDD
jgi:hypothetical protein